MSIFEGFGLPIIEAMKCHVPVITSNTSSPEIAGNAALIVDPHNISEISKAMIQMTKIHSYADLIQKGQQIIKKFKWDNTTHVINKTLLKHAK